MKEELRKLFGEKLKETNLPLIINELRILCANEKSKDVLELVDGVLEYSKSSSDLKLVVDLYELKIKQLYHFKENLPLVEELLEEMSQIATKINYIEGLALSFQIKGYIELLKGNRERSNYEFSQAVELLRNSIQADSYAYNMCNYSYAVSKWLSCRDFSVVSILENSAEYFHLNYYYHGFAMALGILIIIYMQTQNKKRMMKLIRKILSGRELLLKAPKEIQSMIHYFIGIGHELNLNLDEAKKHLLESQAILRPIYNKSIYSGYYITALSYLASTYALQGELESAHKQMKEVDELIEEGIATRNLDSFSKEQMKHIFNLTKFYIFSRIQNFRIEDFQVLVQTIFDNVRRFQSNAIIFCEFLLNANLTKEQLIEIRNLNNPSTKRVEHIINFLIEKTTTIDENEVMHYTSKLKRRPVEDRMTFTEKAFADLLAAQEYYKINRFAEISPLLRKYENQLHKIEVLEMRVFMEAFIQVGAYKNGDSLGPALQYMAIKKCRQYGFSRLEYKLSDYLTMQGNDTIRKML